MKFLQASRNSYPGLASLNLYSNFFLNTWDENHYVKHEPFLESAPT